MSLREQIEQDGSRSRTRRNSVVNRREARKQARQDQKQRKAAFFSHRKPILPATVKHAAEEELQGPAKKKTRYEAPFSAIVPSVSKATPSNNGNGHREESGNAVEKFKPKLSKASSSPVSTKRLRSAEEKTEDAQIAWLEAKLGLMEKSGKKKNIKFGDGLDNLMADLDHIIASIPSPHKSIGSFESKGDDEDEDEDEVEGSQDTGEMSSETEEESSNERAPEFEESLEFMSSKEVIVKQQKEPSELGNISKSSPPNNEANEQIKHSDAQPISAQPQQASKYIPPHLRKAEEDERIMNLIPQMKGLLNRLSEQNIATILTSIEELYRSQRRNDVTTTLTRLIIDGISSHSTLLDAFVVVHATLVASLHKIVGVDFAAHFIQTLVESYEHHYRALSDANTSAEPATKSEDQKGKECLNLIVLLSELYNFQVISCVLLYDIIRGLLANLDEFDVELLLKIARNSGQQLRHDDPSSLKDIVDMVHSKMSERGKDSINSRTEFMIETLTNLKHNKVKRIANQAGHTETVERMKRFLSGLNKKYHVLAHEPLRVALEDLHSADKRGKWWIVGAAWAGDPLVEHARAREDNVQSTIQPGNALLKLARKQGMNTDIRRSIFVVLMSSDDYVDACERLSQLSLNEVQQREIIRVIFHCLGNEKHYNPFYTLVVQHLCQSSHSYKVTLQYCFWDFLRDMGEKDVGGAGILKNSREDSYVEFNSKKISSTRQTNIARAYAWWIAKGSVTLAVLKPVDFTRLQPQTKEFLQTLISQLFISSQVSSPAIAVNGTAAAYLRGTRNQQAVQEIFKRATQIPILTQGLLYMFKTVVRDNVVEDEIVSGIMRWGRDIAQDTLRAAMNSMASVE